MVLAIPPRAINAQPAVAAPPPAAVARSADPLGDAMPVVRTASGAELMQAGRLGAVRLFPAPNAARFLILFSAPDGWSAADEATARTLANNAVAVAGIDMRDYRRGLAASGDDCHYVVADLEELSHQAEREMGFSGYRSPILVSAGVDSALAYAALSQSPDVTVGGAISVGFNPVLATPVALCPGAAAVKVSVGHFRYQPARTLPGWWRVAMNAPPAANVRAFVADVRAARIVKTPGGPAAQILAALATAPSGTAAAGTSLRGVLPLVELPTKRPGPLMAVIYSGDGGWRDIDMEIGGWLQAHGVAVVGVDSLRYFWSRKPPEQVAADLDRILRTYEARWPGRRVMLVGYSFGADVLPAAYNRLPSSLRASVVQVSLLGLATTSEFEFHVGSWFSGDNGGVPIAPELARMDKRFVQCVYGAEETDTACTLPQLNGAERLRLAGDHHFGDNYANLARKILDSAETRAGLRTLIASRQSHG